MKKDSYMTINKVGEYLGISPATVRNWIKSDKIGTIIVNGKTFIPNEELSALQNTIDNTQLLKSRRNKSRNSANFIPKAYIDTNSPNFKIILSLLKDSSNSIDSSFDLVYHCAATIMKQRQIPDELISDLLPEYIAPFKEYPIKYIEGEDTLGMLYISMQNLIAKKSTGAYYTPYFAVDLMISKLSFDNQKICDPSCGTGNFLLRLPDNVPLDNIYGYDIDELAISIARINLATKFQIQTRDELEIIKHNIRPLNYLLSDPADSCDIYIGNPPWGYNFSPLEKRTINSRYFKYEKKARPESFALFIEKSVDLISKNGLVSFLLPESILDAGIHEWIRSHITNMVSVQSIHYLGDIFDKVQCPCVILTVGKELENDKPIDVSFYKKNKGLILTRMFQVPNNRITDKNFNVLTTNEEYEVIRKISSCPHFTLKDNADFALGIVTGSNKTTLKDYREDGFEEILKGKDIHKYYYDAPSSFINFNPAKLQQVAPEHLYRKKEKLFYKFIANEPVFAYDDTGMLSLNSANILIPNVPNYSIPYIMALLNSPVISYYYRHTFRSVKVLRSAIEDLPLATCDFDTMLSISDLALTIAKDKGNDIQKIDALNEMILKLYDISTDDLS